MSITQSAVLQEFFRQKIQEALSHEHLSISGEVEYYLVQMLVHFAKAENLFSPTSDGHASPKALALQLADATQAVSEGEKYRCLKNLGDSALYQAGVFYEGFQNQMVDIDYYISMGGMAYQSLAHLSSCREKILAQMFNELSLRFARLVEILHLCCGSEMVASNDLDLLKVLDRYHKTGSVRAKEILEEKGILPSLLNQCKDIQ